MGTSEGSIMVSVADGLAGFIHFALLVLFGVVTVVAVRRHRPDAWLSFLGAAVVDLAGTTVSRVLYAVGPAVGLRSTSVFYAGMTLLHACVTVVFWSLLLVGVLKIAKPPRYDAPGARPAA